MSQFVYFTTTRGKPDLAELGLAYAMEAPHRAEIDGGPGGGAGVLLSHAADGLFYAPDRQHVTPLREGVWMLWDRLQAPRPTDLARTEQLAGEWVTLADGQPWLAPRLRVYAGEYGFQCALPRRLARASGAWVDGAVLEEWAAADALGEELLDHMIRRFADGRRPDVAADLTWAEAADLVARVLAINYRVSADELAALGALATDQRLGDVLRVAIDYETAEADALGKLRALAG